MEWILSIITCAVSWGPSGNQTASVILSRVVKLVTRQISIPAARARLPSGVTTKEIKVTNIKKLKPPSVP